MNGFWYNSEVRLTKQKNHSQIENLIPFFSWLKIAVNL